MQAKPPSPMSTHVRLLAGLALEKQYWFAYEAIKKEWSVSVLDNAIKASDNKKPEASQSAGPTSSVERHVTEQFGYPVKLTLNKNETGCFRVHFHDREHMQKILEKFGCTNVELTTD